MNHYARDLQERAINRTLSEDPELVKFLKDAMDQVVMSDGNRFRTPMSREFLEVENRYECLIAMGYDVEPMKDNAGYWLSWC